MKNRVWWFMGFYFLLSLFVINEIFYVIVIWSNTKLFNLYREGFSYSPSTFNPANKFEMFGLPLLGMFLSIIALVIAIVSQSIILKTSTAKRKGIFLTGSFVIFMLGFYLSFTGQLLYNEWNDSNIIITSNKTGIVRFAIYYYQNWFSLTVIWTVFGLFFGFVILAMVLVVKLYFLNVQWARYIKRNDEDVNSELELTAPLPNNGEFDPNQTQTIIISLDKDETKNQNISKKKTIKIKTNNKTKKKFLIKKKKQVGDINDS